MKSYLLPASLLACLAAPVVAQEAAPFTLQSYGHFKRMNHLKNTDGVVDIKRATSKPALYGVGAPADGTGEITVLDGQLWIDYGVGGLGNASNEAQAVLLVTALVSSQSRRTSLRSRVFSFSTSS